MARDDFLGKIVIDVPTIYPDIPVWLHVDRSTSEYYPSADSAIQIQLSGYKHVRPNLSPSSR